MPKFFVNNEQISDNTIIILGEDVNHIKNVLRYKEDDEIIVYAEGNKIIIEKAEPRKNIMELFANFDGEYASVKKDGKWGLINTKGETVLPFEWLPFL